MATHQVCGLTDPFCDHARGAKYPDDSNVRTLPYSYQNRKSMTTTANGEAWQLLCPQYEFEPWTVASASTLSVVTAWQNFPSQSLIAGVDKYRIVSAGFTLNNVSAPLYSSGMVHIRAWPYESLSPMAGIDTASYSATFSVDIPLQDCKDIAVVYSHTAQLPQVFYEESLDTGVVINVASRGFCPVTVYVTGAPPSTTVLSLKHITHYELTFVESTGMQQLATPAPRFNPMITDAAASVTSSMKPILIEGAKRVGGYIVDKAKRALLARMGMPQLAITVD
jgi:hypothetical protein